MPPHVADVNIATKQIVRVLQHATTDFDTEHSDKSLDPLEGTLCFEMF